MGEDQLSDVDPKITDKIKGESQIINVSVRGWIAIVLVVTVCVASLMKITVTEPLYTLVVMACSFYLGASQKSGGK